jgi:hypothetical protein
MTRRWLERGVFIVAVLASIATSPKRWRLAAAPLPAMPDPSVATRVVIAATTTPEVMIANDKTTEEARFTPLGKDQYELLVPAGWHLLYVLVSGLRVGHVLRRRVRGASSRRRGDGGGRPSGHRARAGHGAMATAPMSRSCLGGWFGATLVYIGTLRSTSVLNAKSPPRMATGDITTGGGGASRSCLLRTSPSSRCALAALLAEEARLGAARHSPLTV